MRRPYNPAPSPCPIALPHRGRLGSGKLAARSQEPSLSIAYFDFDLTLIRRNSGRMWLKTELRAGKLGLWQAARAGLWLTRYRLGSADLTGVMGEAISTLEGAEEEAFRARSHAFYEREVAALVRPGALAVLEAHRAAGERCVLLTGSSLYLAERAAAQLQLDGVLCTRFEVGPDGRFTGRPEGPISYGVGKLELAEAHAAALGVDLADCAFYTDSFTDLPVLEAVGRPVAVHPDPRLRRLAAQRGWPCADWDAPGAASALPTPQ